MAEAGSFAERVKQQADIVRVIGEYVRLKKSGQNFTGLCPFHEEKTPSFAVHPVKQIYHCFGCGVGGDVFKFVMEVDKVAFPEAIRIVAEKCGIAIPRPKASSPEERKENQQRSLLATRTSSKVLSAVGSRLNEFGLTDADGSVRLAVRWARVR